jgi:prepilin-type N-terminal cleavage/methylation domain-containing protein
MERAMKKTDSLPRRHTGQLGFTLIEVMISTVILTVGLVTVLGALCSVLAANQSAQQDMLARQIATEAMEAVYTARNDSEMTWAEINNVTNGGIFVSGFLTDLCAGPDGIIGTADDAACLLPSGATCPNGGVQCLDEPGPDGILGTADDKIVSLSGFTRSIAITPLSDVNGNLIPSLRQVTVTVNYTVPNLTAQKAYTLTEYVSSYH